MRPNREEWALQLAKDISTRATCLRRSVGCVLMNSRGEILATGYNGVAAGLPHCNEERIIHANVSTEQDTTVYDNACPGANSPSGTNLDACEAVHAEQNALLQCHDVYEIETCYVTVSPCVTCTKLLMNTSCKRIVFLEEYVHNSTAKELWTRDANRRWIRLNTEE